MPSNCDRITLKNSRSLLAGYTFASKKTRNWLVFLPESASEFRTGSRSELEDLVGPRVAQELNFLVINKPGLEAKRTDRELFERSFRREKRIDDAVTTLKKIIPKGDRIYLVGYSEGAYLAPQVARRDSRVCSVCMIGGGTRGWLKEELSNASRGQKAKFEKSIKEILRNPNALKKWNGFSYATWYSYRGDNTLQALRGLRIPTLAILGARDRVIDLKSTIVDLILVSERQPTQIQIFGDCGHHFTKHWKQVERVLGRFVMDALLRRSKKK